VQFTVKTFRHEQSAIPSFPGVVLTRDNWDDYGYKTTFFAELHLNSGESYPLGTVKIVQLAQTEGPTPLPEQFTQLGEGYASLGQTLSYYEMANGLGEQVYRPLLEGLSDLVLSRHHRDALPEADGVFTSLLRFDSAQRALADAPQLFDSSLEHVRESERFTYELPGGASTTFSFGELPELPDRLNVIIGYNGAGKTRMLANLAMLAHADAREASDSDFMERHGRYVGDRPHFGAIVAISYSAFDDFAIPGEGATPSGAAERDRANEGERSARSYAYCGLRQVDDQGSVQSSLKSIDQLTAEFHGARSRALRMERIDSLRAAMEPVYEEPSFRTIADLPDIASDDSKWLDAFLQLSTGHKIVLNIVTQLCANLEKRSMVLLDEPELHLHPPLLAALLQAVGALLELHSSFAVVATHSPVVLQEVPSRSVKVLRRDFTNVTVEAPEIETYAENVGLLTKLAFNLDSSNTDFQGVLRTLATTRSVEEIEELFGGRMSSQARSLVLSFKRVDG
jgi:predicted ATPase